MSYQFTTTPTTPNPYIACTVNNMNLIMILNKEKKNWTKKYYKIIQGLETMADVQLQLQNIIKLVDTARNQLPDIETTLLQTGEIRKVQIGRDIYSIYKIPYTERWNIKHIIFKYY